MYWLTGILGLALMLAPYAFNYSDSNIALWTSLLVGAATILVSWIKGESRHKEIWEYWGTLGLGFATLIAPLVLGFANHTQAMLTSVIAGILLVTLAGSKLLYEQPKY